MKSSDVTFKTVDTPVETPNGDEIRAMDVCEIKYPDGKVVAFPATDKSPESGIRYADMWPAKYQAFKNGEPDPDRVDQLNREIDERKAELDGLKVSAKDDKRVQDNLGYGKTDAATKAKESTGPNTAGAAFKPAHKTDKSKAKS